MSIRLSHAGIRTLPRSSVAAIRGVALPAGALGAAALAGCTLLADEFDPQLVSQADAGPLPALVAGPDTPSLAPASSEACGREGAAACATAIGLVETRAPDAGLEAAPPTLALPPCSDGFGEFGEPELLTGIEFDDDVFGPALSGDGRTLYFSAYVAGEQQIYAATREARGAAFADAVELTRVNSPAMDGSPYISVDGQRLYFFSEREPGGIGRRDIWVSERDGETFGAPSLVLGVNSSSSELLPWLTSDELTLLFVSGRPGGRGGADVWRATRDSTSEAFGEPRGVADLSSSGNEGRAVLSSDGSSAFFSSDRAGAPADIWTATRQGPGAPFSELRRVDVLNSSATELDVMLSSDDSELFFASTRGGSSALYRAERACR